MTMHLKYLQYVLRHKWYVFLACLRYGLIWQGITHDWSKFLPSEWLPYAKYFYGKHHYEKISDIRGLYRDMGARDSDAKEYWEQCFNEAWNHHQKRQPHHWQYWLLTMDTGATVVLPMPDHYRKEMIADWRGASKAIKGVDDTVNWYKSNYKKMQLHPATRTWVEHELGLYAEEGWGLHNDGIARAI
jgi:hypothetical protein